MIATRKIRALASALILLAGGPCGNEMVAAAGLSEPAASGTHPTGGTQQASGTHSASQAHPAGRTKIRARRLVPESKPNLDLSGRTKVGKASFYAKRFEGQTMADGTRMQPTADNAASRTLPLGTTAKVTNLETGKTAVVTIRDRGPYVAGRIVDLSPSTARAIGLDKRTGVARVEVAPIAVPMPHGETKLGDGALRASNRNEGGDRPGPGARVEMRTRTP